MQNILYFLYRYGHVFLFLFLELICFNLLVRFNPAQKAIFIRSSNHVSGWVIDSYDSVIRYLRLNNIADELAQENANLRVTAPNYMYAFSNDRQLINDSLYQQQYELVPARVINNSIIALDNYFTLKGGTEIGIQKGMGVIGESGIVGIIIDVNKHYARGISVLNRDCMISSALEKNHFFGTLFWTGGDPTSAKLGDIPKHAPIHIGDKVVTSGFSTIFPAGIDIGIVSNFELGDGSNFYDVDIKLANDLSRLDYVYVVRNLLKEEQLELEE